MCRECCRPVDVSFPYFTAGFVCSDSFSIIECLYCATYLSLAKRISLFVFYVSVFLWVEVFLKFRVLSSFVTFLRYHVGVVVFAIFPVLFVYFSRPLAFIGFGLVGVFFISVDITSSTSSVRTFSSPSSFKKPVRFWFLLGWFLVDLFVAILVTCFGFQRFRGFRRWGFGFRGFSTFW